jgi:hypothetical protein
MPTRKVANVRHELRDRATSHAERYGGGKGSCSIAAMVVVWEGAGGGSGIGGHVIRHRQAPANQKLARVP